MTDSVWFSDMMSDSMLFLPIEADIAVENVDFAIEASKLMKKGRPVSQDYCPKTLWVRSDYGDFHIDQLPDLFLTNGYWIVSEAAANILRSFDMGEGALYPVTILHKDKVTPFEGNFYCWIFGNSKAAFLEEESPTARPMDGVGRSWCLMPLKPKDDEITVSRAALGAPDVWIDTKFFKSVFFSGPLGEALDAAGMRKSFKIFRCRISQN